MIYPFKSPGCRRTAGAKRRVIFGYRGKASTHGIKFHWTVETIFMNDLRDDFFCKNGRISSRTGVVLNWVGTGDILKKRKKLGGWVLGVSSFFKGINSLNPTKPQTAVFVYRELPAPPSPEATTTLIRSAIETAEAEVDP